MYLISTNNFQKKRMYRPTGMHKRSLFNVFQIFQNLCTKEHFSMISSNVYSKIWTKWFSLVFSKNIHKNKFFLLPNKFSMWNQVFLVKLNSLDANFSQNCHKVEAYAHEDNH